MKTWNWKRMIRVVLILLAVSISVASLIGCSEKLRTESFSGGRPLIAIECENEKMPLNAAKLNMSLGLFQYDDPLEYYIGTSCDEMICFALYYCYPEDILSPHVFEQLSDYTNIDNHHFIKAIDYETAFKENYRYWYDFMGSPHYSHLESLLIPQEILERFGGSLRIKLLAIGSQEGETIVAWSPVSIKVSYTIIDGEYVQFVLHHE